MGEKWAVEALNRLGLTEYEARAYMALNLIKAGNVSDIHAASGVPRSAIYGALAKLEDKGIVEVEQGKPMRYRSIAPAKALDRLRSIIDAEGTRVLGYLEEAHARGDSQEPSDAVWTVRGVLNLYNKYSDMINDAEKSIIFITHDPLFFEIRERYPIFNGVVPLVKKKLAAGVRMRLVCAARPAADLVSGELRGIELRTLDGPSSNVALRGAVIMVDDAEVLISTADEKSNGKEITAIHTRMDSIISVMRHFTEVEWDAAAPPK